MSHPVLAVALAALIGAGPALAGGYAQPIVATPVPAPVAVPPAVASADWSGGYAGAQIGYGSLSVDDTDTGTGVVTEGIAEGGGALLGLHAGYLFDFGRVVAGAEVDWDRAAIAVEGDEALVLREPQFGELTSVARAKLRLGFDAGRMLPYLTGGVARASFDADPDFEATSGPIEESYDGRFVGVGASYAVSDRFLVGVEALRHEFDPFPDNTDAVPADAFEDKAQIDTITLRGSFRF